MNLTETRAKALLGLGLNKKNLANRTNAQLARALNQCAGTSLPLPPMTKTILNGYEIYTAVGSPLSARQFVNLFAGKTLGPIARKVGLVPTGISKREREPVSGGSYERSQHESVTGDWEHESAPHEW